MDISYCEQTIFHATPQPINALSNLFYFIVALLLIFHFKKNKISDKKSRFFIIIIFLIGVGSFIWHFSQSEITFLFDLIPIGIFLLVYCTFLTYKISKNKRLSLFLVALYFILGIILTLITEKIKVLNGAEGYVLTFIFFIGLIAYSKTKNLKITKDLVIVLTLFLIAFLFRQVDLLICEEFSLGTHFIWHLFTAIGIFFSIKTLYR